MSDAVTNPLHGVRQRLLITIEDGSIVNTKVVSDDACIATHANIDLVARHLKARCRESDKRIQLMDDINQKREGHFSISSFT